MQLSLLDSVIGDLTLELARDNICFDVNLKPGIIVLRVWTSLPWSPKLISIKSSMLSVEDLIEADDPTIFFRDRLHEVINELTSHLSIVRETSAPLPTFFLKPADGSEPQSFFTLDSLRRHYFNDPELKTAQAFHNLHQINPLTGKRIELAEATSEVES